MKFLVQSFQEILKTFLEESLHLFKKNFQDDGVTGQDTFWKYSMEKCMKNIIQKISGEATLGPIPREISRSIFAEMRGGIPARIAGLIPARDTRSLDKFLPRGT